MPEGCLLSELGTVTPTQLLSHTDGGGGKRVPKGVVKGR